MRPDVVTAVLLLMCITAAAGCFFFPGCNICHTYPDVPCDDGWSRLDENRCVKYINSSKNFHEAQEHCRNLTGNLVSLHNLRQMFMVICLTRRADSGHQSIWIGAQRSETRTEYTDGSDFNVPVWLYDPRNHSEPEACIKLNVEDWGSFNDTHCSEKMNFVCAKNVSTSTADQ